MPVTLYTNQPFTCREDSLNSRSSLSFALVAGLALGACSRDELPVSAQAAKFDRNTMVTVAVAQLLDKNGRVPSQQSAVPGAITPTRAAELATAYLRLFGPNVRHFLESVRGDSIDFASLQANEGVMLAESQFEPLDPSAPPPERKHAGPYYVVTFSAKAGPVLTVAVSSLSSDLSVDSRGLHSTASIRGNDFLVWPVPLSGRAMPALSAEEAMATAFKAFGEPIDALPVYERKGTDFYPQEGAWRLVLAHPVSVRMRDNSAVRQTQVLYVIDPATYAIPVSADYASLQRQTYLRSAAGTGLTLRYRSDAAQSLAEVRPTTSR